MLEILSLASEVDKVDKDTPLSSLDIDSIGQVTVCAELEERFGIQCDPSMILSSKTPRDLFNLIEEHTAEPPNNSGELASLVTLSQNTEAILSIVFIHPGHGGIDCYKPSALKLAASMPVNFYAIANPLNDCEFDSIHQMAQKYLELIDSKLSGRVIFSGWSFGGVVAREMNVLRSNIQADPVILFDSWAGFSEAFNNKALFLQKYGPIFKENYGTRWLEHLWNRVSLMTKMPITVANDRVILVKATKILAEYEGCNEEFNHWAKYVGSIEKIDFDSNHDVMFEESNLSMLVKVLEKALTKLITL